MSETQPTKQVEAVTLTINEQEVTVPTGTNVLEAAKKIDIDLPAFCYHPGLSIAACCRQCLVKVEGVGKLQPACQQECRPGMQVHTQAPNAVLARKQLLEFTLLNHPVDCPICDKAGECTLQKHYFDHHNAASRVDVPKVSKPKMVDLGPTVVLDAERCILCTRCIRVCDEVAGEHQLEMQERGDREQLGTAPGALLDNPYSLNTVDVCPVGALTAKDFRFTMRAWELMTTPSVCNGCATGCNIEIHHKANRAWRLVPRENPEVNQFWMCDEGRLTYHPLRQNRLASPSVEGLPASWERATTHAAKILQAALERDRSAVGVVFSAQYTNEDNYVLARLARDIWQLERLYATGKEPEPHRADDKLRDADVNPNYSGMRAVAGKQLAGLSLLQSDLMAGDLRALLILGDHTALDEEAMAAAAALDALVVISAHQGGLADKAHVSLPAAKWAEVHATLTNRQGKVQRMHAAFEPPGRALPAWQAIARLGRAAGATLNYTTAKSVFVEMAKNVAAIPDQAWGHEAMPVQLRFAHSRG